MDTDTPPPDSSLLDSLQSRVPPHLQVLYLTILQENHLPPSLATGLRYLFIEHSETFATGSTDLDTVTSSNMTLTPTILFRLSSLHVVRHFLRARQKTS